MNGELPQVDKRKHEAPLEGILDLAMDAIIAIDEAQRIIVFNRAAEKMFGCSQDDAIGSPVERFIPERFRAAHRLHIQNFADSGVTTRTVDKLGYLWGLRTSGEEFPIEASISRQKVDGNISLTAVIRDATERMRTEVVLRENEERFRLAMNNVASGLYTLDQEGLVTYVNPAAEIMFGWTNAELLGKKMHDVTHYKHPDGTPFPARDCPGLRIVQTGTELREHEDVFIRKDGSFFPVVFSAAPLKKADETIGLVVGFRDDSQRREGEARLRQRLEFETLLSGLSRTFINLPEEELDANMERGLARFGKFLEIDRITLFEFSSDRTKLNSSYSWNAANVKKAPDSLTANDLPWWWDRSVRGELSLVSQLDELPEEASAEKRYLREGGIVSAASIPSTVGGQIDGVISFISVRREVSWTDDLVNQLRMTGDIFWTALKRKRATEELLAAKSIARESEKRFRVIANTAPVMIWMSDTDGLCTYFNQQWLKFTGRPLEAELENGWTEGVHVDDLKQSVEAYAKALNRHEPYQIQYRLRHHDGQYRWILSSGVPRHTADGAFAGYIGSAIDITDRKLAEEALATVSHKLIEAHEGERTRISRELHDDINQRIALIAVNLEQLKKDLSPRQTEFSRRVAKECTSLSEIASDIQALSHRLHSSRLEHLGLEVAARSFCAEISRAEQVEIDFHAEGVPNQLAGDVSLSLFRVLQEALHNSIKYSRSGQFQVSFVGQASEIELIVQDSGIGFNPEEAIKGHGLGLISMRERLQLLAGQLSIDSRLGHGTTVRARVPLAPKASSAGTMEDASMISGAGFKAQRRSA